MDYVVISKEQFLIESEQCKGAEQQEKEVRNFRTAVIQTKEKENE